MGALLFAIASILAGLGIEGYNPIKQYISESYAAGMPYTVIWQYFFICSGILLFFFGIIAAQCFPKRSNTKVWFFLFAIFYGIGTLLTGIYPCDAGCYLDPENPRISQFIHNTVGTLTYAVVPFCILALSYAFSKLKLSKKLTVFSAICGTLCLLFVVLLFSDPEGPYRGLFQRVIEASIISWIVYLSFYIKSTKNQN
jgi:hypothetical protein